jgi:uncharacterized membrane protein YedE/YeeE
MMDSVLLPLLGGGLIGLAASVLLLLNGQIAGISGILQEGMTLPRANTGWRIAFLLGLLGSGVALFMLLPEAFVLGVERGTAPILIGGLLVGFGTRLGSGCTSGHGVCGLSGFSKRSFVAVMTFMGVAVITVALTHQWLGGAQ